ncbi:MAG: hypothetical protein ACFFAO_05200, partial [Candidatus Hermodarchaeota archaeon]
MNSITKKKVIFYSLLIFLIISATLTGISKTSSNQINNEKTNDDLTKFFSPKTAGTEINIITPENKTYASPMAGYYPATYSFDGDLDG